MFLNALVFNVLDVLLEEFVPFAVELEVVLFAVALLVVVLFVPFKTAPKSA